MRTILPIKKYLLIVVLLAFNAAIAQAVVLHNNGPLINSPGSGAGGADESVLQTVTLGMGILGFGHQVVFTNVVADDFTVPAGPGWIVDNIDFYAYQNGSTTTSTFTDVRVQIWDGPPAAPGSNIVFGDLTTNRLANTAFSNIYRVDESTMGNTQRPIMENQVTIGGITLAPGTYWLAWQADGTLGSGPWAPLITINGQNTTGDGLQSIDNGATYAPVLDVGGQGFPFIINGTEIAIEPVPTLSEWSLIVLSLLLLVSGLLAHRSQRKFF